MSAKTEELRKYELMVVVKALLPDDVRIKSLESVKSIIADNGGAIKSTDIWGKKYLAYKIDGHNEGYYVVYEVELPPASLNEVNKSLNLQSELLRFIIVTADGEIAGSASSKEGSVIAFDKDIKA